jgi:hypothetical protein
LEARVFGIHQWTFMSPAFELAGLPMGSCIALPDKASHWQVSQRGAQGGHMLCGPIEERGH